MVDRFLAFAGNTPMGANLTEGRFRSFAGNSPIGEKLTERRLGVFGKYANWRKSGEAFHIVFPVLQQTA